MTRDSRWNREIRDGPEYPFVLVPEPELGPAAAFAFAFAFVAVEAGAFVPPRG